MCYFPGIRMACGHQEMSRIALHCPTEARYGSFCMLPEEIAADESHICKKICRPTRDLSSQGEEVRSGEMCGSCQVATGEILDGLVRDINDAKTVNGEQWMVSGGLDADSVDIVPENVLDDIVRDLNEAIATNGQHYMVSGEQYPHIITSYPENALNDFKYVWKGYLLHGKTPNTHMISDVFARGESGSTCEDTIVEWSNKSDDFDGTSARYQIREGIFGNLSKPYSPVQVLNVRAFHAQRHAWSTSRKTQAHRQRDSLYQARNRLILAKLQDEEGGRLGRIGWVCCEKCGAYMHLRCFNT